MEIRDIIRGCKQGKRESQSALYKEFSPKMYGVVLSYVRDREAAKDILHDSFMKVFKNIRKVDPDQGIEGWMRRIVVNTSLDYLRRNTKFRMVGLENAPDRPTGAPSPLDLIRNQELLNMLGKLPDGARAVFILYAVEGYNHREIAQQLKISEGTSKSQYSRARSLLRNIILSENEN